MPQIDSPFTMPIASKTRVCSFTVGNRYTKQDIYAICRVPPERQKGNWNTGYTNYNGDWFIFCGVGVPGRTGHDYDNHFEGDDLVWFGKHGSHIGQDSIRSLLNPNGEIYIFYREADRDPFTFAGIATVKTHRASIPVQITWSFAKLAHQRPEVIPEEVEDFESCIEGASKTILVNAYERNPQARKACIDAHGCICSVCDMSFEDAYGDIGKGFIHVHHLIPLSEIKGEYLLNPLTDLRPVCPNCHAMLHRRRPAYSIEEMIALRKVARVESE